MTEQYILGEMLNILIKQDTDLNVERHKGLAVEHLISSQRWKAESLIFTQNTQEPDGIWC